MLRTSRKYLHWDLSLTGLWMSLQDETQEKHPFAMNIKETNGVEKGHTHLLGIGPEITSTPSYQPGILNKRRGKQATGDDRLETSSE